MDLFGQVVTDADEIFTYFEVIRQLSPSSILDVGMMLKRMGAVSRQAMHCAVPQSVRLDGIDFYPEVEMPIYGTIYDHIYSTAQLPKEFYNLSVCLGVFPDDVSHSKAFDKNGIVQQWLSSKRNLEYLSAHSSAVLMDADAKAAVDYLKTCCACQILRSGERPFVLAYPKGL